VLKPLVAGVCLALAAAGPAAAQDAQILQQIADLAQRVGKLEQENARLVETNDRLEATVEYLRANASETRKTLAEDSPKVEEADKIVKGAEWLSRIGFKGDVRFRNESIDQEHASSSRNRDRIRARLGAVAKVNDKVTAEIQITTDENLSGGSDGDARSPNRTLSDANSRKEFDIDTAFVSWAPNTSLRTTFGKMRYAHVRPAGSLFFDNDINPEGAALNWQQGPTGLFASTWYFDLAERSSQADSNMAGAQVGWRGDVASGTRLTLAGSYFGHGAVQGYNAVQDGNVAQNNFGNTTSTTICRANISPCIASDFDVVHGFAELAFTAGARPLSFFGEYAKNMGAESNPVAGEKLDTAYAAGIQYGRVTTQRTWELAYLYQHIENDGLYAQWIDSDFGAGNTGSQGSVFRLGYGFGQNWRINATYFLNETNIDVPASISDLGDVNDRGYERLQLDLVAGF
jgi:hypothetical protein